MMYTQSAQQPKLLKLLNKLAYYLSVNISYLRDDPNFFVMKYLARFSRIREGFRQAQSLDPEAAVASTGLSLDHPLEEAVAILHQEGYYQGLRLSSDQIEDVLTFAYSHPCYANRSGDHPIWIRQESDHQQYPAVKYASYLHNQEDCQTVRDLATDPRILAMARQHLGRAPIYMHSDLLWSFPRALKDEERLAAAQVFHCDINDYRSLKFFFYITDVSEQEGPHYYIQGTHRQRRFVDQLLGQRLASKADERIIQDYGAANIKQATGPAGFGFAGDPYCIHRGSELTGTRSRLLLQVEFGLKKYRTYYKHKILTAK